MNNEKDISEDGGNAGNYFEKTSLETPPIANNSAENIYYEKEKKQREEKASIEALICEHFPEEKREIVKNILKKITRRRVGKEEMCRYLSQGEIDPHEYNRFILHIIALAHIEKNRKPEHTHKKYECKALRIKGALKEQFLLEIKKDLEDSSYIAKTQQQYSFFKRTPEDLSSIVSSRPHLISLFSANYNVLCSKIKKILSIRDLHNRLKKGSFEYKLNEQVPIETAACAYTVIIHYIKEMIGKCLDMNGNLDKNLLIKTMFGNVRGVYLLYSDYPPVECFQSYSN